MNLRSNRAGRLARILMAAAVACVATARAQDDPKAATPENFSRLLDQILAERGDICLGLFDWPIDLTEAEAGSGARHALQFPVLERLGLVRSTIAPVPKSNENPDGAVKRFELTDTGRQFYKPHVRMARDGVQHASDFCVAHVTREKIVDVHLDTHDARHSQAVVSYTYKIEPAPWMQDAEAQRVFPMVAHVINGAGGRLQLRQGFMLTDSGWVAEAGPV